MGLLKINLFRLRKSLSSYVVFVSYMLFMLYVTLLKFTIEADTKPIAGSFDKWIETYMSGDIIALFVIIIAAIFVSSEINNGAFKNIYGKETHKYKFMLTKLITLMIYIMIVMVATVALSMIVNVSVDNKLIVESSIGKILGYGFAYFMLYVAIASMAICLATITESNSVTLIVGFLYAMFGHSVLGVIETQLLKIEAIQEFRLSNYTIMGNMYNLNLTSAGTDYIRAIIVSVIVTAAMTVIGSIILGNKDIT
jgi:ABC-type transport system involved in multi-copper enzyme maturation permease subunit